MLFKKLLPQLMLLSVIIALVVLAAVSASADSWDCTLDYETNQLVAHLPAGWGFEISDPTVLQTVTDDETGLSADDTDDPDTVTVRFAAVEYAVGSVSLSFGPEPDAEYGTVVTRWQVGPGGLITSAGTESRDDPATDNRVTTAEDGKSLTVTLRGELAKGECWTYYPENGGLAELVNAVYTQDLLSDEDGCFTFTLSLNDSPAAQTGSLMFRCVGPSEEMVRAVFTVNLTLDGEGRITGYTTLL